VQASQSLAVNTRPVKVINNRRQSVKVFITNRTVNSLIQLAAAAAAAEAAAAAATAKTTSADMHGNTSTIEGS